jgi:uncharacterized repeat protein (TIGR01451 family)
MNVGSEVLLAKFDPAGGNVYMRIFGGTRRDEAYAVAVDADGNAYVTGNTVSVDFPTTPGAFQTPGGDIGFSCILKPCGDAFVSKINAAGDTFVYSNYLASSSGDTGNGIAVDAQGKAYVTGSTRAGTVKPFPITAGAFQTTYGGGISDAFVTQFSPSGALVYSTFLGGSDEEGGTDVALDPVGNAYVTGYTQSFNFPTANPVQTTKGDQDASLNDAFVAKLNAPGTALVYATYLGGNDHDLGYGIAVDLRGTAAITGATKSFNFPTLNAFQPTRNGPTNTSDAFVAVLTDTIPGGADLDVVQSDAPDPVVVKTNLTYTLTVTNSGPAAATGVTLTDTLPTGVTFVSASAGCTGTRTVTCALGTLASGVSATVTIRVKPTVVRALSNTASVMGNEVDPDPANNTDTETTTVSGPDLVQTAVSNPPASAQIGTSFTVTDTVQNQGAAAAGASTTRYYLSLDSRKSNGDKLLTGSRAMPMLTPGAESTGTTSVTIGATIPPGTYFLLACADDLKKVTESQEGNNCRAAVTQIIAQP